MSAKPVIAVIGLGRMGVPVMTNLTKAGFAVRGWNRTPKPLSGLTVVPTAADAVADADIIILLLSDRAAVEALLFDEGLAERLPAGAILIDMGTTGPLAARAHAARLQRLGVEYLDVPVSGGVKGAETAKLALLAGGKKAVFEQVRPILSALGTPHHLGVVGAGQMAKVANQMIVACYIAGVSEGIRFAEDQGLDGGAFVAALEGGFADSAILRQHGRKMAARNFAPGGTCRLHLKDLELAAELGGEDFRRYTNTAEAMTRFRRLIAAGFGETDHSAYYLTYGEKDPAP